MNTKLCKSLIVILVAIAAIATLCSVGAPAPAKAAPQQLAPARHEVVLLQCEFTGSFHQDDLKYHNEGAFVINSSSSAGAPQIPNYPDGHLLAAETIAELISAGYELQRPIDPNGRVFVLVK
ncbi:MAG TPA: hypothetical protein VI454_14755 [Verrucomicrobiae bacterium]|jgi:hypothetical protein